MEIQSIGTSRQRMITLFLVKFNGQRNDGLGVFSVPIQSQSFCQDFIASHVKKMEEDLENILEALDNLQTQLQLFKICTFHKITHIVVAEVLFNDKLPNNWHLWDSPITNSIANIYSNFMAKLTNRSLLPPYALHISSMSTNK